MSPLQHVYSRSTTPDCAPTTNVSFPADDSESHQNRGPELTYQAEASTSMSHQRARLPPELIDIIISMLRTERAVLAICALVCRSWLPTSRHHLHSHITISPRNYYNISRSLTAEGITSVVEHLELVEMESLGDLREVICKLSNITKLSIYDSDVTDIDFFQPAWILLLRDLESLEFVSVDFETEGILLSLFFSSPRLRSLHCDIIQFRTTVDDHFWDVLPTSLGTRLPELKLLKLLDMPDSLYRTMARLAMAAPRLTTLILDSYVVEVGVSWETLLKEVGSRLQELRLFHISDDLREHSREIGHVRALGAHFPLCSWTAPRDQSFAFLAELRSVGFSFEYDIPQPLEFVVQALRHLTSPYVQELTVTLFPFERDLPNYDAWSELDLLLESPRFAPTLRAITFRAPPDAFRSQEGLMAAAARDQYIAEQLPLCAARGIVRSLSPHPDGEE
jgi:hypothetical protein